MIQILIHTANDFDPNDSKWDEPPSGPPYLPHPANTQIKTSDMVVGLAQELVISSNIYMPTSTITITMLDPEVLFKNDPEKLKQTKRQIHFLYSSGVDVRIVPTKISDEELEKLSQQSTESENT